MLTILIFVLAVILAIVLYLVTLSLYRRTREVLHTLKMLDLDRQQRERDLQEPSRIFPDAGGAYPMLQEPRSGRVLDADRGLVFDWDGLLTASPEVHKAAAIRRIVQSLHVAVGNEATDRMLGAPEQQAQWPQVVDLRSLFVDRQPSIEDLVVGVYLTETGQGVLSASLHDLMHVLAIGASGWGKSSWLRSLLWQLALAGEPVEVVAVDVSGSEFNVLYGWGRLRYPVAREPDEAAALLVEVSQEVTKRKGLYEAYPMASNLPEYNGLAAAPLLPWVILVDEGSELDRESLALVSELARERDYDVWLTRVDESGEVGFTIDDGEVTA